MSKNNQQQQQQKNSATTTTNASIKCRNCTSTTTNSTTRSRLNSLTESGLASPNISTNQSSLFHQNNVDETFLTTTPTTTTTTTDFNTNSANFLRNSTINSIVEAPSSQNFFTSRINLTSSNENLLQSSGLLPVSTAASVNKYSTTTGSNCGSGNNDVGNGGSNFLNRHRLSMSNNNTEATTAATGTTTTNSATENVAENVANSMTRNSCIIDRLSFLCLNESLSDVHFLVGSGVVNITTSPNPSLDVSKSNSSSISQYASCKERIAAHKLILSIGSQVFMAMFYGSGSQMAPCIEIEIPDVEPEPFKHMLRYLYTDELYIEPDSVMSTLYVAKKYAVSALERECVDFLKRNLKPDNSFMLLQQARLFDENQLAELCLDVIDKHSCEAFGSDCFADIDLNTLILILKRDSLGIREFKLYYYVLKWAQSQCIKQNLAINRESQQTVLGDAIKFIRFPLMSKEEFAIAMNENESRIIDDESIIDLFINLTLISNSMNGVSANPSFLPKKLKYSDKPRCCLGGKEQVINRFCQVESRWGYSGTSDRVRFSVNRRIFVVGFGLYGSIYGKCEYQVIIQLIHYDSCTTCAQNNTTFICDGTNATFRVLFKEPIEIAPDIDYIAAATLKGPDSFYGTKGLRKVIHDTGGKVTFHFQYASGNNNGTSVEDGQIPEIIFLYSC